MSEQRLAVGGGTRRWRRGGWDGVPAWIAAWTAAMEAHASQVKARNYVRLQLARANLCGVRFGLEYAIALFPNDPIVIDSLDKLNRGTRRF